MSSIFTGIENIFIEKSLLWFRFFTVKFLSNDVFLMSYEACGTRKFSFKNGVCLFLFAELNCHYQNYQCSKTQKACPKTSIKFEEMF